MLQVHGSSGTTSVPRLCSDRVTSLWRLPPEGAGERILPVDLVLPRLRGTDYLPVSDQLEGDLDVRVITHGPGAIPYCAGTGRGRVGHLDRLRGEFATTHAAKQHRPQQKAKQTKHGVSRCAGQDRRKEVKVDSR